MKNAPCKIHVWPRQESLYCIGSGGVVKVLQCNNCLALRVTFHVDGADEEVRVVEPARGPSGLDVGLELADSGQMNKEEDDE